MLMLAYNVNANIRLWQQSVREGEYPYVDSQRKKTGSSVHTGYGRIRRRRQLLWTLNRGIFTFILIDKPSICLTDSIERILLVMRTYGVTHVTYNNQESLKPLYSNQVEGFELINEKGLRGCLKTLS